MFIASLSPPPAAPAQVIRVTCRPDLWAQFGIAHLAPAATQETTEPRCHVKNQHVFSQTGKKLDNLGGRIPTVEPPHTNIALKREGKVLPRDFTTASRADLFKMFKDKQ